MKHLNFILLSLWLILVGVVRLLGIDFTGRDVLLAVLEIAAGVLLMTSAKMVKAFHKAGNLLLAILLIISGLVFLAGLRFTGSSLILGLLSLAAGIVLPMGAFKKKFMDHAGTITLSVLLIFNGLIQVIHLRFHGMDLVNQLLFVAAGILLIFQSNK